MVEPAENRQAAPRRTRQQVWRAEFWRRLRLLRNLAVVGLVLFVVGCWHRIVHVVPAGYSAVLFRPFFGGLVTDQVFGEGLHITLPWNSLIQYEVRLQERKLIVPILANTGLGVEIDVSVRFHPIVAELPLLHRELGPNYIDKVVLPIAISAVREVAGSFQHQQLFHASSAAVEQQFLAEARREIADKHVHFDVLIVRKIQLPEKINRAIENKLREEEMVEEYEYRLKREVLEADRKRIEGKGIQDFQALVQKNLSTRMLYWRGVRATVDLAKSTNAKVVVLGTGGGKDGGLGLPIIMGGWDGTAPPIEGEDGADASSPTTDGSIPHPNLDTGYDLPTIPVPSQAPSVPAEAPPSDAAASDASPGSP